MSMLAVNIVLYLFVTGCRQELPKTGASRVTLPNPRTSLVGCSCSGWTPSSPNGSLPLFLLTKADRGDRSEDTAFEQAAPSELNDVINRYSLMTPSCNLPYSTVGGRIPAGQERTAADPWPF